MEAAVFCFFGAGSCSCGMVLIDVPDMGMGAWVLEEVLCGAMRHGRVLCHLPLFALKRQCGMWPLIAFPDLAGDLRSEPPVGCYSTIRYPTIGPHTQPL